MKRFIISGSILKLLKEFRNFIMAKRAFWIFLFKRTFLLVLFKKHLRAVLDSMLLSLVCPKKLRSKYRSLSKILMKEFNKYVINYCYLQRCFQNLVYSVHSTWRFFHLKITGNTFITSHCLWTRINTLITIPLVFIGTRNICALMALQLWNVPEKFLTFGERYSRDRNVTCSLLSF